MDQVYQASAYPTLKTDIPILLGTGGKDRDVFVLGQKALAREACEAGDRVEWHFYPELDHSGTVNGSLGIRRVSFDGRLRAKRSQEIVGLSCRL